MPSPSLIDSVGHSGTHAPQAMQSSVIFMVMVVTPSKICYYAYKINLCHEWRQMTNIFYLVNFVTVLLFCQILLQKSRRRSQDLQSKAKSVLLGSSVIVSASALP